MAVAPAPGPTGQSLRLALGVLGAVLVAVALVELVLLAEAGFAPLWLLSLFVVNGVTYAGTGLLLWARRPSNRTGLLLVVGGLSWLVAGLLNTAQQPLAAVGAVLSALPPSVMVHVLLAFPSGRLAPGLPRATVIASYAFALVSNLPANLFTPGSPIFVADVPALAELGPDIKLAGVVFPIGVAVVLLGRFRRASAQQRRTLGPLYLYGTLVTFLVVLAARLQVLLGIDPLVRAVAQLLCLAVVPLVVAAVLLRGGFGRAGEVEEIGVLLTAEQEPPQHLLARVLGDPSLELLHWLPAEGVWVDVTGQPRSAVAAAGRGLVEVTAGGQRRGALTYDEELLPDPELVRLAARPAGLALEAERLAVELRRSRARLVAAADEERRRLASDLHDGLQVRLVLLGLEMGTLAESTSDRPAAQALRRLRQDVDDAAAELRRTVQALLPAALLERGLEAAVQDLVDRLPLLVVVEINQLPEDLPVGVVTTAWYVVTEALTNALKHAGATRLHVRMRAEDGLLHVQIGDDGAGGALAGSGTGLRGLVDRLDVLGARLDLDSPPGEGTRLSAAIPYVQEAAPVTEVPATA